ncbi:MAG: 5-(carboxyamino)imidazole ribonucleotide mutase [Elusimicrobiota bacterium]|jgi:5-(carboxyamino)imidazole ribonucleotide mutase
MKKRAPAKVGILMGSRSDLGIMSEAAKLLGELGVSCETRVISAHRAPELLVDYARGAQTRGLRVLIAGAGGAAALPGMLAALSPLPVIGVPVATKSLGGLDALLSIVQMPPGVPVATVAVDGAKNAAWLAARILALEDAALARRLASRRAETVAKAKADQTV